jgi:DNA-binding Lrp family transcriptional regulator
MDAVDQRLISILRHDGRRSISDLALELGVSRGTVRARLAKLEAGGAIIGYTVVLRADAVSPPVRGLTMIEVEGRMLDRVIDSLVGFRRGRRGPHHQRPLGPGGRAFGAEPRRSRRRAAPPAQVQGVTASETTLLLATPRSARARL